MPVASVVLALLVALVVNVSTPPVYAAQVTFFLNTLNVGSSDLLPASLFSQSRLKSYEALLTSDRIVEPLAGTPGLGLTAKQVRERITAETVPETVMLVVTVEDGSPDRAQLLTNALVGQFGAVVRSLESTSSEGKPTVRVEVVAGPRLLESPVVPRPLDNYALALLAGLLVGAGLAVAREVSDSTIRSSEALQTLVKAAVLAAVPVDTDAPTSSGPFVSDGNSARAEALRRLRMSLQYAEVQRSIRTLAVTSAVPGEGRSATACSLALLFAESGQRVVVVDAELRHPRLAAFLGREGSAGLSTVLTGAASVEQALQPWGAGLWLLSTGQPPPNPSELLSSSRMTELVAELRRRFDIVIFDCPPVLPVTDAVAIAARTDGTLLVVRARRTKSAELTTAVRALRAVNPPFLGCVLNMVPTGRRGTAARADRPSSQSHMTSTSVIVEVPVQVDRSR